MCGTIGPQEPISHSTDTAQAQSQHSHSIDTGTVTVTEANALATTSDRRQAPISHSQSDEHGRQVGHVARRVWQWTKHAQNNNINN